MTQRGSIALARSLCYQIAGAADERDDLSGAGYGSVDIAEILSAEVLRLQAAQAQATAEPENLDITTDPAIMAGGKELGDYLRRIKDDPIRGPLLKEAKERFMQIQAHVSPEYQAEVNAMTDAAEKRREQATAEPVNEWKNAVLDSLAAYSMDFPIDTPPGVILNRLIGMAVTMAKDPAINAEPVAWTLTEELTKRETTTRAHLWFSDPVNCMWTPLYTAPPDYERISALADKWNLECDEMREDNKRLAGLLASALDALEKLACLGNRDTYGNSVGNCIAQDAIAAIRKVIK